MEGGEKRWQVRRARDKDKKAIAESKCQSYVQIIS